MRNFAYVVLGLGGIAWASLIVYAWSVLPWLGAAQ
jgi:hypothetical protein